MESDLTSAQLRVVVGEWAPAATDCAKYLNGRGIGSRYDGSYPGSKGVGSCTGFSGKASTFSESYKKFLRQYWEAQAITYEKAQGWIQWTWKAEIADEWSYQAGLENGWIPKDPTDFEYPNICGRNTDLGGSQNLWFLTFFYRYFTGLLDLVYQVLLGKFSLWTIVQVISLYIASFYLSVYVMVVQRI